MRELLPYLDRKIEILGSTLRPGLGGFWNARSVESGIDLDGVEVPRIKLQLIGFGEGVKDTCPRAGSSAGRIAPPAGSDAPDARIFRGILEKLRQISFQQTSVARRVLAYSVYPKPSKQ